jgi:hypothetical protein
MTRIEENVQSASRAMCAGLFREADEILQTSLQESRDKTEKLLVLQSLVHLYSHPGNQDFSRAKQYIASRESLDPSASTALSNANFFLYIAGTSDEARHWADLACSRARTADDFTTLYSSIAMSGLIAAQQQEQSAARALLHELDVLVADGRNDMPYGDAVPFLEASLGLSGDIRAGARDLARMIAPKIEDLEFRARAIAIYREETRAPHA